ncbi:MAG TPA: alanine--tRNA ligase, partial [Holosporales bacterium]|nr:alanine--tRNA ligase [Holosporales bacterium]
MHTLSDIRHVFLNYFQNNGHTHVPSSPVVPQNDPTLMFTNAGMVPFKDVFTGKDKRDYVRATSAQKCIRAGGKHNDLDNVGYTARHHTFFEMLGNFSFGDYFKEQAIKFAWDVLTKEFALPAEKLVVTVYAEDTESALIWKKITGFSDDKIIKIGTSDNFWSMGDVGPCGPCTEIFYDHGEQVFGGLPGTKNQDGDRFIEIWNIVFMQYEQLPDGTRLNLKQQSVDTGMGLERIAAVLQGVHNNYDIDLFQNLIQATQEIVGNKGAAQSYNIIADHLRSCSFMIADGVMPSNEGRGYVLRRIMRRAMRHAHLLGAKNPLMHQLVPALVSSMGTTYTELPRAQSFIEQTFKTEEEKFRETLSKGLKLLEDA